MGRRFDLLFTVLIIILLSLSACGGTAPENSFLVEDDSGINPRVPEDYTGLANPYIEDPDAIAEGDILFQANCSSCHGSTGEGDGPASAGLDPSPKNLAEKQPNLSDSYLFWRISEGGLMDPFNSLMPGWKGLLSDERIWQVIAFIRTMVVM